MKRETVGTILVHWHSGRIEPMYEGKEFLESESQDAIDALPRLPKGSFYAFHAERLAKAYEIKR